LAVATKSRRLDADLLTRREVEALMWACSHRGPTGVWNRALIALVARRPAGIGGARVASKGCGRGVRNCRRAAWQGRSDASGWDRHWHSRLGVQMGRRSSRSWYRPRPSADLYARWWANRLQISYPLISGNTTSSRTTSGRSPTTDSSATISKRQHRPHQALPIPRWSFHLDLVDPLDHPPERFGRLTLFCSGHRGLILVPARDVLGLQDS
jgi:hypothetical protein